MQKIALSLVLISSTSVLRKYKNGNVAYLVQNSGYTAQCEKL